MKREPVSKLCDKLGLQPTNHEVRDKHSAQSSSVIATLTAQNLAGIRIRNRAVSRYRINCGAEIHPGNGVRGDWATFLQADFATT